MATKDILIYESGNGGDFSIIGNDLALSETLYQQVFLALFGGNIEESTKPFYLSSEERNDYWGNELIWPNAKSKQFNSETERLIQNVTLNGLGRLQILQAANNDLAYLNELINFEVEVEILSTSSIRITVNFTEKTNQQNKVLQMVYSNAKNEVIIENVL
jgi:hypothetical protein